MGDPGPQLPPVRRSLVEVDLGAIAHNVRALRACAAPTPLWAVVKADGYGHGAVPVARAALEAGAEGLAVALVEEGEQLRAGGIVARTLLLSEAPPGAADRVVAAGLEPTAYSLDAVAELGAAAGRARTTVSVHLKVDTGMHRVGIEPEAAVDLATAVVGDPALRLASMWTHLAVADAPDDPFTGEQLARFERAVAGVRAAGIEVPATHAAGSAGAIAHPSARLDLVRVGIALYGIAPGPALVGAVDLRPALRLTSRVSHVKRVAAGEAVSYGLRYRTDRDTIIATVPLGYADGVRRRLGSTGGEVLVDGRRRPIAGTVTMDQITVDCGPGADVARDDEVVLLGRQGDEVITAEEWAERLDTIGYEVTCGLGPRVPRVHRST